MVQEAAGIGEKIKKFWLVEGSFADPKLHLICFKEFFHKNHSLFIPERHYKIL